MSRPLLHPMRGLPAAVALVLLTTAFLAWGDAPARAQMTPHGIGCGTTEGVTVVVDFTDLGGSIEVGCAEGDPASGREALESAGFTPTDSNSGRICAINAQPDPCPEESTGSSWSYWHGEDGEWASYGVSADKVDPALGAVEGWRYSDGSAGSAGPGLAPAAAVSAGASEATGQSADDAAEAADQADFDPAGSIAVAVVALVLVTGLVLVLRRRRAMREE